MNKNELILVLNCGSSSLKFAILDRNSGRRYLKGLAENLYQADAQIHWALEESGAAAQKETAPLAPKSAHTEALHYLVDQILVQHPNLAKGISAIGHRVVHGGEQFTQATRITADVIQGIEDAAVFAPLHNPAHLLGITAAQIAFPHLKDQQVAVFDTAFHQTMPEAAYLYALPYALYQQHGIRRYGAHGTSHAYVTLQAATWLEQPVSQTNVITCHLGNGCSITAVKNGESVDTSMGLTPLEGLVMGTRCGDLDPAIIFYLHQELKWSVEKIQQVFTKESGILGLTEKTGDFRHIEENYTQDSGARRAFDVFVHRLAKYIAAYTTVLDGRLDALVFTGGIGENAVLLRKHTLEKLALLGFKLDDAANKATRLGKMGLITQPGSTKALVIPTDEEWMIAQETFQIIEQHSA